MARRTKASDNLIGFAVIVGLLVWAGNGAVDLINRTLSSSFTGGEIFTASIVIIVLTYFIRSMFRRINYRRAVEADREAQRQRVFGLMGKYNNPHLVKQIMIGQLWHDMSKEQLLDALGAPDDIETKVMKTKIKEVYKYGRIGVNRFAKRVVLENDAVVGWEEK